MQHVGRRGEDGGAPPGDVVQDDVEGAGCISVPPQQEVAEASIVVQGDVAGCTAEQCTISLSWSTRQAADVPCAADTAHSNATCLYMSEPPLSLVFLGAEGQ